MFNISVILKTTPKDYETLSKAQIGIKKQKVSAHRLYMKFSSRKRYIQRISNSEKYNPNVYETLFKTQIKIKTKCKYMQVVYLVAVTQMFTN